MQYDSIHIFKTDIEKRHFPALETALAAFGGIIQWNVDTEDCDRVLRVVSHALCTQEIIGIVTSLGFLCQELE